MNSQYLMKNRSRINIVLRNKEEERTPRTESHPNMKVIDHYFSSFIGLSDVKDTMKQIYAMNFIQKKREKIGLIADHQVLHMIFTGNPGTGKTTFAREVAQFLHEIQFLSKGQFIEVERADLVGEYIGQTAQKTRHIIQRSLGGVLFIDEAYSLARGGEKDFGREAIDTLVKSMEDYSHKFVLILAGYPEEMELFLNMNPGLASRFPFQLSFPDFSIDELIYIAIQMAHDKQYRFSKEAQWKLRSHLRKITNRATNNFSNARTIRNIVEQSIRLQSKRLLLTRKYSYNDLLYIQAEDLKF